LRRRHTGCSHPKDAGAAGGFFAQRSARPDGEKEQDQDGEPRAELRTGAMTRVCGWASGCLTIEEELTREARGYETSLRALKTLMLSNH
jgi:hypothetical protein